MEELVGERGFKPFECVGTKKESLTAFYLSLVKNRRSRNFSQNKKSLVLLNYFKNKILPKHPNLEKESKKIITYWNAQHNLAKDIEEILI